MQDPTTFTLTIKLGNDAMQTPTDVADQLERAAAWMRDYVQTWDDRDSVSLLDMNGNYVGGWAVSL